MDNKKLVLFLFFVFLVLVSFSFDDFFFKFSLENRSLAFDFMFGFFTKFSNVLVIFVIVTTLFLWEEKKRDYIFPLWISLFIAASLSLTLKYVVARPRPSVFSFPFIDALNYSFPSMHVMVAFAALPILNKEFPKIKFAWILFAVMVAINRIYFGYHFFSDVIFGAVVGYLIGCFVVHIEKKYKLFAYLR